MTADEWLEKNQKKPLELHSWVSQSFLSSKDQAHILPREVFRFFDRGLSKVYKSKEEALTDFRQAFNKAMKEGWDPEKLSYDQLRKLAEKYPPPPEWYAEDWTAEPKEGDQA